MSLLSVLTVIFIVLKLVGVINWSWWLVLFPTLAQLALVMIFGMIGLVALARRG